MFGHPDPYHHTIQDDVDKVDPSELKRVMMVTALSSLFMANSADEQAVELANETLLRGYGRIAKDVDRALKMLEKSVSSGNNLHKSYKEAVNIAEHSISREQEEVLSGKIFCQGKDAIRYVESLAKQLHQVKGELLQRIKAYYQFLCYGIKQKPRFIISLSDEEKEAKKLIPSRNPVFTGPLSNDYLIEALGDERIVEKLPLGGNLAYEAANFINGKRSLLEVRNALSAEYGPIELSKVKEYLEILQRAGLVRINPLE